MRKLITLALTLMLALTSVCSSLAQSDYPAGVWYLTHAQVNDEMMAASEAGINCFMDLSASGFVHIYMGVNGEEQEVDGTWAISGDEITLISQGPDVVTTLHEGYLYWPEASMNGYLIFTHEDDMPELYSPGALIPAETQAQFNGFWKCEVIDTGDTQIFDPYDKGTLYVLIIDNNEVFFLISTDGENNMFTLKPELTDGMLMLTSSDGELLFLNLHDDNTLSYYDDEGNAFYFRPYVITAE